MKKNSQYVFLLLSLSGLTPAFAGHVFVEGDYGVSTASLNHNAPQITYYQGYLTDSYPINRNHQSAGVADLQAGYEFLGAQAKPAVAFGLGWYGTPTAYQYAGQVIETPLNGSLINVYTYRFKMRSNRLMAQTRLTWQLATPVASFLELGAGEAWTPLGSYHEVTSEPNTYVVYPPFQPRNNARFAYQVGAGLAYTFNLAYQDSTYQHERVILGYRFSSLGSVKFRGRDSNYPYSLNLGELDSSEAYLGWMHLF